MKKKIIKKGINKASSKTSRPVKKAIVLKQPLERKLSANGEPMTLNEIEELIKFVAKSGVSEVELQNKDFKLIIKTQNANAVGATTPMYAPIASAVTAQPLSQNNVLEPKKESVNTPAKADNLITIKSPMIGTFYRSSSPDKPLFVNVGDEIKEGKVLCIIEAMKLFNEIESEVAGRIVKILVDDATPVEYDQPLFLVEPA